MTERSRALVTDWLKRYPGRGGHDLDELIEAVEDELLKDIAAMQDDACRACTDPDPKCVCPGCMYANSHPVDVG